MFSVFALSQNLLHHVPFDVRQSEIAALVVVGQARVIEPEQVQDRRLQVVDVNGVLDRFHTEVVGLAQVQSRLDAGAGQPDGERGAEVVAAQLRR